MALVDASIAYAEAIRIWELLHSDETVVAGIDELISAATPALDAVTRELGRNELCARTFNRLATSITTALVGCDPARRDHVLGQIEDPTWAPPESVLHADTRARLTAELEAAHTLDAILVALGRVHTWEAVRDLAGYVQQLAPILTPADAGRTSRRLVDMMVAIDARFPDAPELHLGPPVMTGPPMSDHILAELATVVATLGQPLDADSSQRLAALLVERVHATGGSNLVALSACLASIGPLLSPTDAAGAVASLLRPTADGEVRRDLYLLAVAVIALASIVPTDEWPPSLTGMLPGLVAHGPAQDSAVPEVHWPAYRRLGAQLPAHLQDLVLDRWLAPDDDIPFVLGHGDTADIPWVAAFLDGVSAARGPTWRSELVRRAEDSVRRSRDDAMPLLTLLATIGDLDGASDLHERYALVLLAETADVGHASLYDIERLSSAARWLPRAVKQDVLVRTSAEADGDASSYPSVLTRLASACDLLDTDLGPQAAEAAFVHVSRSLGRAADPNETVALVDIVCRLPRSSLRDDEVEQLVDATVVLLTQGARARWLDPQLIDLAGNLGAIGSRLTEVQVEHAADALWTAFAQSSDPLLLRLLAVAIAGFIPKLPRPRGEQLVVDLLGHPFVTAAARDEILQAAARRIDPPQGRWTKWGLVDRIARTVPDVDLDSPAYLRLRAPARSGSDSSRFPA